MRFIGKISFFILALPVVLGAGCGPRKTGIPTDEAKVMGEAVSLPDCKEASNVFACILDRSMEAKDPSYCESAGEDKRMNCVEAYAEITGSPVECRVFTDPKFRVECEKAFSSVTSAPSAGDPAQSASAATSASSVYGSDGLRLDRQ